MLIRDIALSIDKLGWKVKVVKSTNEHLEGQVGELTFPFGTDFEIGEVGIFLNNPVDDCDIHNLGVYDEVEFI